MNALRKEIRNTYRGPDKAYSTLDFYGTGSIKEADFFNSIIPSRVPFSIDELKEFCEMSSIFKEGMNLDSFKKTFFPHLYLINEDEESEDERKEVEMKKQIKNNKEK